MNNRPIVILGCARSGTTLLTTMLHAHPRLAMPPETRFVQAVYRNRDRFGDLRQEANRRKVANFIVNRKGSKFADLKIDSELMTKRVVDAEPTIGSLLAAVFEEFAAVRGKERWGDKRPSYAIAVDRLLTIWPDLQIVHLVRDPRACVASLLSRSWWKGGVEQAVTSWLRVEAEMRKFERRAEPGQYYRLRYEDLVTDPQGELTRLCGFLGEEFDESMLHHDEAANDIVMDRQLHHINTHRPVDPSRIEAWRTELTPEQIGLIELVARRPMRLRGYEPSGIGVRPPLRTLLRYATVHAQRKWAHTKEQLDDARKRKQETYPVAAAPKKAEPAAS